MNTEQRQQKKISFYKGNYQRKHRKLKGWVWFIITYCGARENGNYGYQ